MCYQLRMVSLCRCYGDLGGQRATIGIMDGGKKTLLSTSRPFGMEVPSSKALGP